MAGEREPCLQQRGVGGDGDERDADGDAEKAVEFWTKVTKESSDEKVKADAQERLDEVQNQNKKKG